MNAMHKTTLLVASIFSFFIQPNWFYENFWAKADFYESIPFAVPLLTYLLLAAALGALVCEGAIRFVKKCL
jgi:hypothetical protein